MKWKKNNNILESENYQIIKSDDKYRLILFSFFDKNLILEESDNIERLKKKASAHSIKEKNKKKCLHCKQKKGDHKSNGLYCPHLWSKGKIGYTSFSKNQKFKAIYTEKD